MTSPKSPAAEPGFSPAVGEMCEGTSSVTGERGRGVFKSWDRDGDAVLEDHDARRAGKKWGWCVTRSSLRPLATPAASEETYGTRPKDEDLPRELPAGTPTIRIKAPECAIRLENRFGNGLGYWGVEGGLWYTSQIDWSKVPKRPSPQPVPAAVGSVNSGSSTVSGSGDGCNSAVEAVGNTEPPQPGQSHPSVWGIPRAKERNAKPYGPACLSCGQGVTPDANVWTDPSGAVYDLAAWGVKAPVERKRVVTTCSEPGCTCPYCRNRAFSPVLGATDPRYNAGRGPAHSALDLSIASARRAKGEVDAHPRNWPEQISTATYED